MRVSQFSTRWSQVGTRLEAIRTHALYTAATHFPVRTDEVGCKTDYGWTFSKSHKGCQGFCKLLLSFLYYITVRTFLYCKYIIWISFFWPFLFQPQTQPGPGLGSSSRVGLDVFDPSLHGGRSSRRMANGWRAAPGCHQCRVSLSLHHTCLVS